MRAVHNYEIDIDKLDLSTQGRPIPAINVGQPTPVTKDSQMASPGRMELLKTIHWPKNLKNLQSRLPKSQYHHNDDNNFKSNTDPAFHYRNQGQNSLNPQEPDAGSRITRKTDPTFNMSVKL